MMKNFTLIPLVLALSACAVGPDFKRPEAGLPGTWQRDATLAQANISAVEVDWWEKLGDPQLTSLVQRAGTANFDVRTAAARLEQSRSFLRVSKSAELPSVNGSAGYQRGRNSQVGLEDASHQQGKAPYEVWQAAADASWEVDLWGHVRRSVEAATAEVELSQAQRDAVMLSVAAETASDYIQLRGVQAKLKVARENLDIAKSSRDLTQERFRNGVTTNLDTSNSAAQVATIQASIPTLEARQERLINALSLLLGEGPRALKAELQEAKPIPHPAPDVPMGLPSELAQRRPDIREREAALHRATAEIGVAKADFYPRITLGASFGTQALAGSDLGDWNSRQWSYGPSLYLPIFQGGRLTGTLELRKHQQQEAAISYQRAVLNAWHEVDDALTDYKSEQARHAALLEAVANNSVALQTAQDRYREGAVDYLNVLSVQKALLAAQSELVDSATQASIDRVQLYKTLGGGWPNP
jgi:NodT family efflux transporter outer membrane factor (OMF) lipoprotein